jgi:hypothetical protein
MKRAKLKLIDEQGNGRFWPKAAINGSRKLPISMSAFGKSGHCATVSVAGHASHMDQDYEDIIEKAFLEGQIDGEAIELVYILIQGCISGNLCERRTM